MQSADDLRSQIIDRAVSNSEFRQLLMDDPKGAIQSEFDIPIPENIQLNVLEDSSEVVNLVLPPIVKLDISELEATVGGYNWAWY